MSTRRRLKEMPTKTGEGRVAGCRHAARGRRTGRVRVGSAACGRALRRLRPLVGRQRSAVDDGEPRREALEVDRLGAHEQRVREERVPGGVGDHADRHAVRGLRADEAVEDVDLAPPQVLADASELPFEELRRTRPVGAAPGDVAGLRFVDDERSAGERPVRSPVVTTRAPLAARMPSPRARERAVSSGAGRLRWTGPTVSPASSSCACTVCSSIDPSRLRRESLAPSSRLGRESILRALGQAVVALRPPAAPKEEARRRRAGGWSPPFRGARGQPSGPTSASTASRISPDSTRAAIALWSG